MPRPAVALHHRLLNVLIAIFGLGHLYAAFRPSVGNWGFHPLAFLPGPMQWLIPAAIVLLAFPRVQLLGVRAFRRAGGAFLAMPPNLRKGALVGAVAAAGALFALFSSSGIPGDGQFVVHGMHQIRKPADVSHVSLHEPLTSLITWFVAWSMPGEIDDDAAEASYRIVSILCGLAFLPLLASLTRRLVPGRTDRMLAYLMVIGSGTTLLFFGHIENYTVALLGTLVFILLGLRYLAGESPLASPSVAAAILIPLYFGMSCVLPAVAYLFGLEYMKTRSVRPLVAPAALSVAVCLGLLLLTGFTPERFAGMMSGGGGHLIGIFESSGAMTGYTLFSGLHLADLANLAVMIAPFSIFLVAALAAPGRSGERRPEPAMRLMLILAVSCGIVVVLFRCDLGMSRDWDLLTPYLLGAIVLSIMLLVRRTQRSEGRRAVFFAAGAATLLHMVPWIVLDHDPALATRQNRLILEGTPWIEGMYTGYEGLAMAAKRRGELDSAAALYRLFLKGDSTHARILGNLADVYRILGKGDSEMVYTERAVRHSSSVPALYFNLGVLYAGKGRFDDAIRVMRDGLRMEPGRPDILNSIGAFILRARHDCREAMPYFLDAIRSDPSYAMAYLNAGDCSGVSGDTVSMRQYLTMYARLDPGGAARYGVLRRMYPGALP